MSYLRSRTGVQSASDDQSRTGDLFQAISYVIISACKNPISIQVTIQIIRNNAATDFVSFICVSFQVLVSQADLSAFPMLRMLQAYAVQF